MSSKRIFTLYIISIIFETVSKLLKQMIFCKYKQHKFSRIIIY